MREVAQREVARIDGVDVEVHDDRIAGGLDGGEGTFGDTHGRFGLSFYIYALLFVAFDIEVIFIYLWAIVFRSVLLGGFVSMLLFVGILLLGLAYAWRKGVLTWR